MLPLHQPARLPSQLTWTRISPSPVLYKRPNPPAHEAEIATGERRLIELDGGRVGPVKRGKSTDLQKVRTI